MPDNAIHSLISLCPVPGRFYLSPKVKKNNPGHPIISGIGTVTEKFSRYVDTLISNVAPTFPSHLRDTAYFLSVIIYLDVRQGSLLVTLDVAPLYTNIPHADGIMAVVDSYEAVPPQQLIDGNTLADLLTLTLELNNFAFEEKHYVQANATSMCTRIWPEHANIFMRELENNSY